MRHTLRVLVVLMVGLTLLVAAGYWVLVRTAGDWFEADLALRSRLAVSSASRSLQKNWRTDPGRLAATLSDITRDERVLGAAACSLDGTQLAATDFYPKGFSCSDVLARMQQGTDPKDRFWATTEKISWGRVHLSVVLLEIDRKPQGAVVLVHDMSHLDLRERTTRNILLVGLLALFLLASLLSWVATRVAWRGWTQALRRALLGEPDQQFLPLLRDVRELAGRLAEEREQEFHGGRWNPDRLRAFLTQYLQGEQVVILANREPYIHQQTGSKIEVLHPASGLVTALEPIMRACSGVWVAHGSGSADRETVDKAGRVRVPPGEESYLIRRVWLTEAEENGYYYGFSNEGLWPLCHVAHQRPQFRTEDYEHYVTVNQRFAEAVCQEVDSDDPIVFVQDYHFALAPRMIRERLPRATIIAFWHIPWPNAERIGMCPWHEELISGLLGASVVGFHTRQHCNNFIDSVDAYMESRIDRESNAVVQGPRRTLVRPYPISIEWPVRWLKDVPPVAEARREVLRELGLPEDTLLGLGVDRLDYTKGIEERLSAFNLVLERYPEYRGKLVFVQLAAPSRTKIPRYQELNQRVEQLAEEINRRWGNEIHRPVLLLRNHHEPASVFRFFRAADFCYVSSLHDGMNVVSKEFVAARDDEQGVLLLSQFTGAARELTEALIVNPYDLRQASEAMVAALRMPADEQRERMRSMRRITAEFNVYRWAGRILADAAELRRKERLFGRLGSLQTPLPGILA